MDLHTGVVNPHQCGFVRQAQTRIKTPIEMLLYFGSLGDGLTLARKFYRPCNKYSGVLKNWSCLIT